MNPFKPSSRYRKGEKHRESEVGVMKGSFQPPRSRRYARRAPDPKTQVACIAIRYLALYREGNLFRDIPTSASETQKQKAMDARLEMAERMGRQVLGDEGWELISGIEQRPPDGDRRVAVVMAAIRKFIEKSLGL